MDLSIIILSYNTKDITDECLRRLQLSSPLGAHSCQIIVLDNASKDGSVEMIKKKYPWVELIESKENTGYSKGNNIAFKKAKYPAILFLNSDAYLEQDTLFKSIEYFKIHNCDALGVKLIFENGSLQPSAGNLPDPLNTVFWILGLGQIFNPFHSKNESFFSQDKEVGWIMGAFLMIKKEVFERVGEFDEKIFMYMDEVDLCKRIKMAGYKICFTPTISVTHLHRASSKDFPELALTKELNGIKLYLKKYFPNWYGAVKFFLILGLILRIIAFSILGKTARARAYIDGLGVI